MVILSSLLFLCVGLSGGSLFALPADGKLIHDWGGSYRRYLPPPEHDAVRREVLDAELLPADELRRLPAYDLSVRFFSLIPEEPGQRWLCFTFGDEWNLERPGRGSWVIKRDRFTKELLSIRIFLSEDGKNYLDLTSAPSGEASQFSIYLQGRLFQRQVPLSLSLSDVAHSSFEKIAQLSSAYVDWSFYFPAPESLPSGPVKELSSVVRTLLPRLHYSDDGVLDENGNYIFIGDSSPQTGEKGLNCSGFVKWIVDGIAYPRTGKLFSVAALKKRRDDRGNRWSSGQESERDPYFGLDWTRNLALAYRRISFPDAQVDQVNVEDLAFHPYREDVGYPVSWLNSLAWELAVREAGYFYLLAVNEQKGNPPLREYFHTAALFPYLDDKGDLQVIIFESGEETPVEQFIARYPIAYVHLVRVAAERRFDPPAIRLEPTLRRP